MSVKRGVGAGVGVGISLLYIFFNVFFLYFNRNPDFSQFLSAVYCYNIFRYKEDKNVVELMHFFVSSQTVASYSSQDQDSRI